MDFKNHLKFGIFLALFSFFTINFSYILCSNFSLNFQQNLFIFSILSSLLILVGALSPDIDSHSAIPHKFVKNLIAIFVFSISFYFLWNQEIFHNIVQNLEYFIFIKFILTIIFSLLLMIIALLTFKILTPKHRGIMHSPIFGFTIALLLFFIIYGITKNFEISLSGIFFFAGFLLHLLCDGIL